MGFLSKQRGELKKKELGKGQGEGKETKPTKQVKEAAVVKQLDGAGRNLKKFLLSILKVYDLDITELENMLPAVIGELKNEDLEAQLKYKEGQ